MTNRAESNQTKQNEKKHSKKPKIIRKKTDVDAYFFQPFWS